MALKPLSETTGGSASSSASELAAALQEATSPQQGRPAAAKGAAARRPTLLQSLAVLHYYLRYSKAACGVVCCVLGSALSCQALALECAPRPPVCSFVLYWVLIWTVLVWACVRQPKLWLLLVP